MTVAVAPAEVAVTPLGADERATWADFLDASANGTFYSHVDFSAIHAWKVERVVDLVFREGDRVVALLTAGLARTAAGLELRSPFSASFGGLVVPPRLSLRLALGVVAELGRWAGQEGVGRIALQHPPAFYAARLDESLEFALRHAGFEQVGTELTYYLDTLADVDDTVVRNARRAAAHGARFAEADDVGGVWEFLAAEKAGRGHPFDVRRDDLLQVARTFPGRVRVFEVVQDGRRVAALLAYALTARVVLGFHWAQREEAQASRPTDLLILEAARWALGQGFRAFDLGTTTLGGEPAWGVTRFKEKFRPRGALRRRFARASA
jgi:hypothetical protein